MSQRLQIGTPIWYHHRDGCYCEWSGVVTRIFYDPEEDNAQWADVVLDGVVVPPKKACCVAVCSTLRSFSVWTTSLSVRTANDDDDEKRALASAKADPKLAALIVRAAAVARALEATPQK